MRAQAGLWALLLASAAATPAAAQRVQITPFVAAYYSTGELGNYVDPSIPGGQVLQNSAPGFGASLSVMLTDVLGVDASAAYALSDARFQVCDASNFCGYQDVSGSLILTSLAGRYRPRRSNFVALGGLSLVLRGGDVWQGRDSKMSLGAVVGAGVLAQVTPKLGLDVRGELHAYSFDPDESGTSWDPAMAMDFLVKIGVPLGGRR